MGSFPTLAGLSVDDKVLFLGTCCNEKSGCYTMAHALFKSFAINGSLYGKYQDKDPDPGILSFANTTDLSQISAIVLEGCISNPDGIKDIIKALINHGLDPKRLNHIIYITMPYKPTFFADSIGKHSHEQWVKHELDLMRKNKSSNLNKNIQVKLLSSSITNHGDYCIGVPRLIDPNIIAPVAPLDPNACGLIYGNHVFNRGNPVNVLDKICKHIKATNPTVKEPSVYFYSQPQDASTRENILQYAKSTYNIKILFSPKVSLIFFQERLRQLSRFRNSRHITVFCDGACTLFESLTLKLNVLIIYHAGVNNVNLFKEFIQQAPANKDILNKILGFDNFSYNNFNASGQIFNQLEAGREAMCVIYDNACNRFNTLFQAKIPVNNKPNINNSN